MLYPFGFYLDPTMLLLIPGILIAAWAQYKVSHTYSVYAQYRSMGGWSAAAMARRILDGAGLPEVKVVMTRGNLTDHYDPRQKVLRLSETVYNSSSLAALGVAAHECGHALQHAQHYVPLKLRSALVPVVNLGSVLSWPILLVGLFMGARPLLMAGIILFAVTVVFQLITLPVEFNASSRALALLDEGGYLQHEEIPGARKVLFAAAMTYVAATLTAILQLLRLLILSGATRRRD